MDLLLKALSYSKYGWKICGDLNTYSWACSLPKKSFAVSLGMGQPSKDAHYKIKDLAHARKLSSWGKCVRNQLLVDKVRLCYHHYTLN